MSGGQSGPKTFDPSKTPLISETLLKSRRSLDELQHRRSTGVAVQNKRKRVVRGEDVKITRPEQLVREYRIKEGSQNKMKRRKREAERRASVDLRTATGSKGTIKSTVGFVVRIHEGRHASEEIKTVLKRLGLVKKYDATFIRLDEQGIASLKPIDAYVAYGYISNKSVEELVHRRAHSLATGTKKPLTDNLTVEKKLGDKGILCLNDLSHEVFTVGEHFDAAVKLMCVFQLSAPIGSYEKKILQAHDAVEEKGGFLGDEMEAFLERTL